ncbi:MAG TPA: dihydrodipicolinate synthase family protein [Solirubrobacteraceae bacterium]|nr:dihydrodipicolinate synthase family protein [Solirubrobacteraceae bacterium]
MVFDAPAVLPALLTPFDENGDVDPAALADHVAFLIDAGVHGIMPCGTTGETALLEADETLSVVRTVVEAAAGRVPVVAHVGRPSTPATARLIEAAIDAGADGVSAVVPYYYAYGDREIVAHFRALLKAAGDTPLLAYTFPARTGNDLSAEAFRTLVDDGLAGLKDSTSVPEIHAGYLAAAPDAQIFVGSPSFLLESLRGGSRGGVAALANLRPELIVALAYAWRDGDDQEAERLQAEVRTAEQELKASPPLVALKAGVAALMAERGSRYPSALRSPLGT